MQKSIFNNFTHQYSLSKTLRFELKPIGKTRENMDKNLQTFLSDQKIEDAYQILKPVFDKIHEEFITKSLESRKAKEIDFSEYFDLYKKQKDERDKDEKKKLDKPIRDEEKKLRKEFEKLYIVAGNEFKTNAGKDDKNKYILKESGYKVLTEAGILTYVKNKLSSDPACFDNLKIPEVKILAKNNETNKEKIEKALGQMKKFFTYFSGFNQNRENYYSTDEKATAVASRIVDENLPKFVDNLLSYEKNKNDYNEVFSELKKTGKDLRLKNPRWDGNDKKTEFILAYDIETDETSFTIDNFVNCLSQTEIDAYNKKVANLNYLVNLYYQQTKIKLPKFKVLYKQIGCGDKKNFIKSIRDNEELKDILKKAKLNGEKYFINDSSKDTVKTFIDYILNLDNFENIYWSDKAINTISGKYFGNWSDLKEKLLKEKIFNKDKNTGEAKIPKAVQLSDLFDVLDAQKDDWRNEGVLFKTSLFKKGEDAKGRLSKGDYKEEDENNKKEDELLVKKLEIIQNSKTPHEALLKMICEDINFLTKNFVDGADKFLKIEEKDYQEDENKEKIKAWLDSALFAGQILKYWKVKARYSVDSNFADILDKVKVSEVVEDYDVIRNYLTQKPQNKLGKLKLNFENGVLGVGWSETKETEYGCIILQHNKRQKYLAILNKNNKDIFEISNIELYKKDGENWQKMFFRQIGDIKRQLPRIMFSKTNFERVGGTDEIKKLKEGADWQVKEIKGDEVEKEDFKKYNEKDYFYEIKKDKNGNILNIKFVKKASLIKLIDWYKEALRKYSDWKDYDFDNFSNTDTYKNIAEFYDEVEERAQKLDFVDINKTKLDKLVKDGSIYLFEIKNKDNNLKNGKEKKGMKNLHTLYWDEIFSRNLNKPKLGANAEIFYRSALAEKDLKKGNWKNKEIIKNFRFSKERFTFHCPITLNPCLKNNRITDLVNKDIIGGKNQLFLGIDRGEKHLAYYSLVNQKGKILEQGSFNEIFNGNKEFDYAKKLEEKARDRDEARKNWTTIGNIKDLKDGYISQVVRKIVDLAIYNEGNRKKGFRETPVFIVLEDLNIGFKRGRQKIEKQVYQKLELALAKKLNFLVDKHAKDSEAGSAENALQLTPPVRDFGDIKGKQFGIMFYTNPSFTSTTDPITGWRKSISMKKGSEEHIKEQIMKFDDFGFYDKDYYFKYKDANTGKKWTLYSGYNGKELDRYRDKFSEKEGKKHWNPEKIDIVKNLEKIFKNFNKKEPFKKQVESGKKLNKIDKDRTAWESLRFIIDVIQQIRNTGTDKKDNDFILSPVRDKKTGKHFDSRKIKDNDRLPQNGDANGAYNIARKGIKMFERIKEKPDKPDLFIKNEDWDKFVQESN